MATPLDDLDTCVYGAEQHWGADCTEVKQAKALLAKLEPLLEERDGLGYEMLSTVELIEGGTRSALLAVAIADLLAGREQREE